MVVSTAVSKAALRVAADTLQRAHAQVDYFPSYEIITGSQAGGLYFEDDWREVNEAGVAHAMRLFLRHYGGATEDLSSPLPPKVEPGDGHPERPRWNGGLVCDEETIERISLRTAAPPPAPIAKPAQRGLARLLSWLGRRS